jgi:transcriptional regulator with XRE-family HTH domain
MNVVKLSNLLAELAGDMSAEELAEKIGIPGQSMRNYINRPKSKPGVDVLAKIANYMGISLDDLASRIDVEIKPPQSQEFVIPTVEDAYRFTKNLNLRGRVDLCARLLGEASGTYHA